MARGNQPDIRGQGFSQVTHAEHFPESSPALPTAMLLFHEPIGQLTQLELPPAAKRQ
jgi:hypothetical protein